ncbi:MAG: branched-chain amino acid ABC transporter substrate-binding protein [Rhodospirillaceae bacterium]|nr:branched-chain amino acid ABC transporter substrate-binding protein [Rhodospirillales bacterium]
MRTIKTLAVAALALSGIAGATAARADIAIGLAGPMTGPEAQFGEQFRRGALKAIDDINAKGGVNGQKLTLVIGDDACDPKQARSVAEELSSKKVAVVIGHFCSGSSIPASEVYQENGILQISPGSTNPTYTERGLNNVFRVCGRDDQQGAVAADYLLTKQKGKTVGIIHDKSSYGKGLADEFKKALNAKGVKEVMYEAITAGEKDYSAVVTKVKAAKVDYLFLGGYKTEGGLIVRQMRDQGVKTTLMGGDALLVEEFWAITGPAGEGSLVTFSPDPRLLPQNVELVKYFRAQNYEPETYTLYSYAALQAWAMAADKAKSADGKKVGAVLKSGEKLDTAIGKIGFDAKGDVVGPTYVMYVWKAGKYVYAE